MVDAHAVSQAPSIESPQAAYHPILMDRPVVDAVEWLRRRPWPRRSDGAGRTAAIVVNYNTPRLIAEMLFSLLRVLEREALHRIVVVDNSTSNESLRLLEPLQDAGIIEVVKNKRLPYHGPGLNRGMAHLRRKADVQNVWILDSDTFVLRSDALRAAQSHLDAEDATAVGHLQGATVHPSCMLFDVTKVWRAHIPPFFEDGAPAAHMQVVLRWLGHKILDFPFYSEGYAVHLGTGTLHHIRESADTGNRFYNWSGVASRWVKDISPESTYARFRVAFEAEVGTLTSNNLLEACRRVERVRLGD